MTKGVITHDDQSIHGLNLKFQIVAADIICINGKKADVDAWITRVNASELTKTNAQKALDAAISGMKDPNGNPVTVSLPV